MKLYDFIVPTKLKNVSDSNICSDTNFETTDLIYIQSKEDIVDHVNNGLTTRCSATDFAKLNGIMTNYSADFFNGSTNFSSSYFLRSKPTDGFYERQFIEEVKDDGYLNSRSYYSEYTGIRPLLSLDISKMSKSNLISKMNIKELSVSPNSSFHLFDFGEFPKTYVGNALNKSLEELYLSKVLLKTGNEYLSLYKDGNPSYSPEYEFNQEKYVRVLSNNFYTNTPFSDSTTVPLKGTYTWVKVEPITWMITNWDDLPTSINPLGNSSDETLKLLSLNIITSGIPFYPPSYLNEPCVNYWQNSTIRGYLNGINVNNITQNGNPNFSAPNGGDFTQHSFLTEALSEEVKTKAFIQRGKRMAIQEQKGYGVSIDETPMTTDEQLNFYFQNGISFMLHGPSGVGKSDRVKQLDENLESITLRNGILPEEIIGKTRYADGVVGNPDWYDEIVKKINKGESTEEILKELDINIARNSGEWIAPNWYSKLVKKCAEEPNKQHALFIDEITNVKPCEQSLVFHLILNKSIGPNVGKLPDNAVVISAGNSKEESESAYNMPEPLFRRFGAHIYLEPNIQDWLEWGSRPQKDNPSRTNIHPLVSAFVGTYGDKVFYSKYDPEDPPKYAIDPRGLEQLSNIIYTNNNVIRKELITNKFGEDVATNFIAFAKNPPISATDVLLGNYTQEDLPTKFDQKYTLMLSLRNVGEDSVQGVRKFIGENLGGELLSQFDNIWVGDSAERAILIGELGDENIEVDSKVIGEVKKKDVLDRDYAVTIEDFWNDAHKNPQKFENVGIRCSNQKQAEIFARASHNIGRSWRTSAAFYNDLNQSYVTRYLYGKGKGDEVYYLNSGQFTNNVKLITDSINFEDVDFREALKNNENELDKLRNELIKIDKSKKLNCELINDN